MPAKTKTYQVLRPMPHGGSKLMPDDTVTLTAKQARYLRLSGVIGDPPAKAAKASRSTKKPTATTADNAEG